MMLDRSELLKALRAFRRGDFSVRMPANLSGMDGDIAQAFNDVVEMNEALVAEITRVGDQVGREGQITQRVVLPGAGGGWGECTEAQVACREAPTGVQFHLGREEAPDPVLDLVAFYSRNLAVPVRRDVDDPDVLAGKKLFYEAGCVACHVPKFVTRRDAGNKAHAFQLIWPYSDFLLHDMGEGLADGQQVGGATGREWRTPPLWGIGLTETVSGHTFFLHDGRARNLTEAILWHGGEAAAARERFAALGKADRQALITFLESL